MLIRVPEKSPLKTAIKRWGRVASLTIGKETGAVLPDELSTRPRLEETAGIASLGISIPNIEKIASIVPRAILSSRAYSRWRQAVLNDFALRVVLELPPDILLRDSGLETALLYLERAATQKRVTTLFYRLIGRGDLLGIDNQAWLKDLRSADHLGERNELQRPCMWGCARLYLSSSSEKSFGQSISWLFTPKG